MSAVKIIKGNPPLWRTVKILFPYYDPEIHSLAFGNTIYTPIDPIPENLYVHECVHLAQQKYSKLYGILHVIKYKLFRSFRWDTELEAYKAQYKFIAQRENDRNRLAGFLQALASDLSECVGCPTEKARKAISNPRAVRESLQD